MVSGFGAYMKQEFQIPAFVGASILSICTYFTCKKSITGIEKVNQWIIPVLIVTIIHMGVKNVDSNPLNLENMGINLGVENSNPFLVILYAILYASYNCILLIPVLIGLRKEKKKTNALGIALISSVIVAILAFCIFRILGIGNLGDLQNDIPIVRIAEHFGKEYPFIYGIMIAVSIYTSAIAICFSLMENLPIMKGKAYNQILKIVCVLAVLVSFIGFSNLVEKLYPLLGVFGFVQIIYLIRYKYK